ncbi:MAG: pyridoxamine 5'-phosphate oxidase family protein [Burkholderiaceae bacterium]|nr:pyridoxamine 5'-phosphate oxidase family protein [Burkholderiaceae bacterium]
MTRRNSPKTILNNSRTCDALNMKDQLETPEAIKDQIWRELSRATQDRHHAWRTPVFATTGLDGTVNARTLVLRAVDRQANQFQIYTDSRSSKAEEITQQKNAMFVFWSKKLNWQLRVRVNVNVSTNSSHAQTLWQQVKQTASASDYTSTSAPGIPISSEVQAVQQNEMHATHFAVITADVIEMDWLELASNGHRRARISLDAWTWLTP